MRTQKQCSTKLKKTQNCVLGVFNKVFVAFFHDGGHKLVFE